MLYRFLDWLDRHHRRALELRGLAYPPPPLPRLERPLSNVTLLPRYDEELERRACPS